MELPWNLEFGTYLPIPVICPQLSTPNTQLPRRAIAKRRRINSSRSDRCLGRFHTIYQDVRRFSKIFEDFRWFFGVWKKNLFRNRVQWPNPQPSAIAVTANGREWTRRALGRGGLVPIRALRRCAFVVHPGGPF